MNDYNIMHNMQHTVGPSVPGCPGGPCGPGSPYMMKEFSNTKSAFIIIAITLMIIAM